MYDRIESILASRPVAPCAGDVIGRSRQGRAIRAFKFGAGERRISLISGCHADEPVGARMLRHLAAFLSQTPSGDPLVSDYEWWIVPHVNPDGDERNRSWNRGVEQRYDLVRYLLGVAREDPGDDIEFGFPRDEEDTGARPENLSLYEWWREADGPYALHVSLHGMAFAAGPWFLIEPEWRDRCEMLKARCAQRVAELGYTLHDVERRGEKGFFRLDRGFCTRPDSRAMARFFADQNDPTTAGLFRPSSMESIRSFGDDPLTLVSEMPLFITPGVGDNLGPPDPIAGRWKETTGKWRMRLARGDSDAEIALEAAESGLRAMDVRDQMELQLTFIAAGMETVSGG
jgi:hypothetical protein